MSNNNHNIGIHGGIPAGDITRQAAEALPEEDRRMVLWFADWCRSQRFTRSALGTVLKKPGTLEFYSSDSICQLLNGGRIRRGETITPMIEAIAELHAVEAPRQQLVQSGFIETRLFLEIERRAEKAIARKRIFPVFGESQIGKTDSFKELVRRKGPEKVIHIEVPTGGGLSLFLLTLGGRLGIPNINRPELMRRIMATLDDSMLLIVDEAHNALNARGSTTNGNVFTFLRELYNKRSVPMILAFTNEGRDEFLKGKHAKSLQQLWRRRITPLQLPAFPPDDDAALFAQAYGLTPATDEPVSVKVSFVDDKGRTRETTHTDNPLRLQREVLKLEGLGVWIGILQDASDMAAEKRRPISWGAVIKAHSQSLADATPYN